MLDQSSTHNSEAVARRQFCGQLLAGSTAAFLGLNWAAGSEPPSEDAFALQYILGSPMYGLLPIDEVLGEACKIGASAIDIWPLPHANHREQVTDLGRKRFAELLALHSVELGAVTRYDLSLDQLPNELHLLHDLNAKLLVIGAKQPGSGSVKSQVRDFVDSLHPVVSLAETLQVTIGIENHGSSLLNTLDAIRYFGDFASSQNLGLAMAPYHLPQDPAVISEVIEHLGSKLVFFQAWQYGNGCQSKLPKEDELLQMPGRGSLDFGPILAALKRIAYKGWTEIFMHPMPRGVPILETTAEVTSEINRSRSYLDGCVNKANDR